jgi:hypothetical protein
MSAASLPEVVKPAIGGEEMSGILGEYLSLYFAGILILLKELSKYNV